VTATTSTPASLLRQLTLDEEGKRLGFRMTLPTQILILFIAVFPLLMQIYISLTDWSPLDGVTWISAYESWNNFANFVDLIQDDRLWAALRRTFLVMAVCVPAQFFLALGLAVLFVDNFIGKRLFYSILLAPMMVVPSVAGYMFFMLFQSGGPINGMISGITGLDFAVAWLSDPKLSLVAVMIADIWQWTPLMFLILLAGLIGVPEDQLRAATLLGASWWQRFITIMLPRIKIVIVIALAIRVVEIFKIFDTLYVMTGGGPGVATETISVYIYKITTQDLTWAYVAAIALFILITLSVLANMALRRMGRRS
jgi:multiple sugar transport system permease protein